MWVTCESRLTSLFLITSFSQGLDTEDLIFKILVGKFASISGDGEGRLLGVDEHQLHRGEVADYKAG